MMNVFCLLHVVNYNRCMGDYMVPYHELYTQTKRHVGPPSFAQEMFARTICCYAADRLWAALQYIVARWSFRLACSRLSVSGDRSKNRRLTVSPLTESLEQASFRYEN